MGEIETVVETDEKIKNNYFDLKLKRLVLNHLNILYKKQLSILELYYYLRLR